MMNANQSTAENFSFLEGGLFRKAQIKLGLDHSQGKLALIGLCFAWIPLAILTAIEGTLYSGTDLPLLKDIAMNARLLLALPMLIAIRNIIDIKTTAVIRYFTESLLDAEGRQRMLSITLPRIRKLACSSLTEVIIILIVISFMMGLLSSGVYSGLQSGSTSWKFVGAADGNVISMAGKWAVFVSIPFFQFLLLQWIWRYLMWMLLMLRFAQAPLKLLPTHADRAGGLGIIILAQRTFNTIFIACSIVIASQLMVFISRHSESISTVRIEVIGFVVFCLMLLILPLVFFAGKLVKTKQLGLLHLSQLSVELSSTFEKEWLNDIPLEKRIEDQHVDPSMAFDYGSMYDTLQQLRVIPITLRDIISLAAMLLVPFIPILFIYYSAAEVMQKLLGLLM